MTERTVTPPRIPIDDKTPFRRRMWTEWLLAVDEEEREEWLNQFPPKVRDTWRHHMSNYKGKRSSTVPSPPEEPREFTSKELRKIDWDST
ncbi:hypothetical protein [Aliiruegeria lutimaris]|uniref:Uncharacterized protein n=1 Tax=Aliiruegeria lutimaris TaxID=571298 RepID=A0A1G8UYU6_9RHOB|nr:hypothetical protein [Aliiruegeria lutimaris]SDJ59026.1 hypothetical protein SAMN04488026_102029 [Aliiruegeria lutimaris]